jgi:hypothetical protein
VVCLRIPRVQGVRRSCKLAYGESGQDALLLARTLPRLADPD